MKENKAVNNNIIKNNNNKLISVFNYLKTFLNKKPFMTTLCNHVFHSYCLEHWLEIKNKCPYCKQTIPELEGDIIMVSIIIMFLFLLLYNYVYNYIYLYLL